MTDEERSDDACVDKLLAHLQAHRGVPMIFDANTACTVVGLLQLALRHPALQGLSAGVGRRVRDELIAKLADGDTEVEAIIRRGDDPQHDRVPRTSAARGWGERN